MLESLPLRKAVFPVAGLGTRFLPATKASPKEMLPIVDKPLIQYAVEEAIEAGFTEMIFVTSHNKRAIEDHFDSNFELEEKLYRSEKTALLNSIKNIIPKGINCCYVRQPDTLGLGHAVRCAQSVVGHEPFAVILADDLIDGGQQNCLQQMVTEYHKNQASIIAIEKILIEDSHKYGIIEPIDITSRTIELNNIIEKPHADLAPSNLAVVGRYLFTPEIFSYLTKTQSGAGGEIQLTDAISELIKNESVYGYEFNGSRYDCGSKLGYLEATIAYGLKHHEVGHRFQQLLANYQQAKECS